MPRTSPIRFGPFTADLDSGELRREGVKIRLQAQPFQLLSLLLMRPGEVVTRDEIREKLWPADTFVDFDHSLGTAINKVRAALCDSAEQPQFIETLPKRGYRFLGTIALPAEPPLSQLIDGNRKAPSRLSVRAAILIILLGALTLSVIYRSGRFRPAAASQADSPIPLTASPGVKVSPAFSPDGSRIAFAWDPDPVSRAQGFDLYVKAIGSEDLLRLSRHPSDRISAAWSPDGTQIAFHRISGDDTGVYVVPALGGPERKLRPTNVGSATPLSWSSDGKWIAYSDSPPPAESGRIHLLSVETLEDRTIPRVEGCLEESLPVFAHSGNRLAYYCLLKTNDNEGGIYSTVVSGGSPTLVARFATGWGLPQGLAWTADDKRLILSQPRIGEDFELDEIALPDGALKKLSIDRQPTWPSISKNGGKLAYVSRSYHVDIWRKDLLHAEAAPVKMIPSTRNESNPGYSPDGKHIVFGSDRGGAWEIWMSDADGSHLIRLSDTRSSESGTPRWSPDSQKIAFDSRRSGHPEIYIVDISERMPRKVATNLSEMSTPNWSHDGKWLYFQSGDFQTGITKIFRCPINGGDAIAVSDESGAYPVESDDRQTVYFVKNGRAPTINAVPLKSEGVVTAVVGMPAVSDQSLWTVVPEGIYFTPMEAPTSVQYFDFATKHVRRSYKFEKNFVNGLSVSPDGRWLLYTQVDNASSDIMLVENFR
jgi:Tol biopolymer transport system component/DNA-binding winged helix-turn-helix (wHTH) protein